MHPNKVFLDNAATSYPKPEIVQQAMMDYLAHIGASPGRGGYNLSLEAARIVLDTREIIRKLFNAPSEDQVIFTPNVTYSLNIALQGLLRPSDHVVTTSMEHNSVIRPLRALEKERQLQVTVVPCDQEGYLDPNQVRTALRPNTRLIVLSHASNVSGTIAPLSKIAAIAREADLFIVVDTAQTAGVLDLDFTKLKLDVLAFTGHKSLYGPPGTGGFLISKRAAQEMKPLIFGGTGSKSDDEHQPLFLPDKFEAGTANTVGIAGLKAGVEFITATGREQIANHEKHLAELFLSGLRNLPQIKLHGPTSSKDRVATVSITTSRQDLGELAYRLDADYGIMVRSGLHCAPLAHKTLGTFPEGTLRFSFGYFNTEDDVLYSLEALERLTTHGPSDCP